MEPVEDPFDGADYYDVGDDIEDLQAESVEEALERWGDAWQEPGADTEQLIRQHAPVVVTAYRRRVVTEQYMKSFAYGLAEHLAEQFDQEFGDPDGHHLLDITDFCNDVLPLIRKTVERHSVWQCEKAGERTFEADEVVRMLKQTCPEWFI